MLTFLIILAIVVAGVVVWRRRVPLLAKLLGQSESRIRSINRKRCNDGSCGAGRSSSLRSGAGTTLRRTCSPLRSSVSFTEVSHAGLRRGARAWSSTSSLAFRSSKALVARSARTSTRCASASRCRLSRK